MSEKKEDDEDKKKKKDKKRRPFDPASQIPQKKQKLEQKFASKSTQIKPVKKQETLQDSIERETHVSDSDEERFSASNFNINIQTEGYVLESEEETEDYLTDRSADLSQKPLVLKKRKKRKKEPVVISSGDESEEIEETEFKPEEVVTQLEDGTRQQQINQQHTVNPQSQIRVSSSPQISDIGQNVTFHQQTNFQIPSSVLALNSSPPKSSQNLKKPPKKIAHSLNSIYNPQNFFLKTVGELRKPSDESPLKLTNIGIYFKIVNKIQFLKLVMFYEEENKKKPPKPYLIKDANKIAHLISEFRNFIEELLLWDNTENEELKAKILSQLKYIEETGEMPPPRKSSASLETIKKFYEKYKLEKLLHLQCNDDVNGTSAVKKEKIKYGSQDPHSNIPKYQKVNQQTLNHSKIGFNVEKHLAGKYLRILLEDFPYKMEEKYKDKYRKFKVDVFEQFPLFDAGEMFPMIHTIEIEDDDKIIIKAENRVYSINQVNKESLDIFFENFSQFE